MLSCPFLTQATRAVSEMNGRMVEGKPIYVALAQRRDVRKAQLEQQYSSPRMAPALPGPPGRGAPLPGMFPPQAQFQPQFYAGPGAMGPGPQGRPNGPGMGAMYPPQMVPRGMPGVSHLLKLSS